MFRRIMVPVDLAHAGRLEKALAASADLARQYGAEIVFVGVTGTQPGPVARSPNEFADRLDTFARATAERLGIHQATTQSIALHDVTADLDRVLISKAREIGADLIVMGSHLPGAIEHVIGSHAGYVAAHAPISVLIVRG